MKWRFYLPKRITQLLLALLPLPTSTTSTNTTTASTTTTTTAATTTTTTTPATTSPATTEAPAKYSYYNVTDNNGLVCIMLDGNFKFKIEYNIANKTNVTEVEVPEPTNDVDVTGSCNEKDGTQFISIAWGVNRTSSLKFVFTDSKDHQTWTIGEVTSVIYMDAEHFPNAVDAGSSLTSNITLELKPAEVPVNMSYKCFSNTEFSNFTTTEDGSRYNLSVSLHVNAVQFEAFNKLPSKDKFVDEIHCDADKVADIVPIAVGCALAGLIIIVLIAYVVGRRRRSATYQSV
ncbi:Lysosome-associated membrane glycoprotein 1 [Armadillidium vulgare]|nr:Lysosome-associated membrane glycoprotein 1 [Armadillidium vulgare]